MKLGFAFATLLLVILIAGSVTASRSAQAAPSSVYTVNSPADVPDATPGNNICDTGSGFCTLRAAIQEANAHAGADTINLAGIPYLLSRSGSDNTALNGDLDITDTVTINGVGMNSTIIDGNGIGDRIFEITGTVVISGVTIQNGYATSGFGGGIATYGKLTLINSAILSNTTSGLNAWGGGIYNSGPLTLTNSIVRGNATGSGNPYAGGIFNQGTLLILNSTVSSNSTPGAGGGLYTVAYTTTIVNSTINGNIAASGGGIYKAGVPLIMINSTVSGNRSYASGGGLYASSGTTNLFNVTIAFNQANYDDTNTDYGGGVYNAGGSTLNFANSIIALNENVLPTTPWPTLIYDDCAGTLTSQGYNIVANKPGNCTINGSYIQPYPQIGPLQNNGGRTQTHALLSTSPARDAGHPGGCTDNVGAILTTDQRGFHRPFGRCDIGAFEYRVKTFLPLVKK